MDTKFWGGTFWKMLHITALTYPENPSRTEQYNTLQFIKYFRLMIPCVECKTHFLKVLGDSDMNKVLHNKFTFFEWTVNAHNEVNIRIGRPTYTVAEMYTLYKN